MEKHDVVIVGAGPAGLKAAEVLASAGKDVLVLEKNDVVGPKVCAGGIRLKDIKMGIPEELFEKKFTPIFQTKNRSLRLSEDNKTIITISREKLGMWQKKKAEDVGVIIETKIRVKKLENNCVITDKRKIGFNYLIGADGSSSIVRKELRIKTRKIMMAIQYIVPQKFDDLECFFDSKRFKSGYAWIFPHNKKTSIGCCADMQYLSSGKLKRSFHSWLAEQKIDISKGRFEAFPINYDYQGFYFGNVFLAGDAAGFASGLTGEGIHFAFVSGEDIAKKILDKNHKFDKIRDILETKKRHERLLLLFQKSGCFRRYVYDIIFTCAKYSDTVKRCMIWLKKR